MAKPTIAQLREKAVERLAGRVNGEVTEQDLADARRVMNSYYRLCGLDEQLLYLQNDERTYNLASTKYKEEQSERWYKRLNGWLEKYDAELVYFGYSPTICARGTTQDLSLAYFYN